MKLTDCKRLLESYAADVIYKRIERLKARKFVLFPWLRIKWLMRKYRKAKQLLA